MTSKNLRSPRRRKFHPTLLRPQLPHRLLHQSLTPKHSPNYPYLTSQSTNFHVSDSLCRVHNAYLYTPQQSLYRMHRRLLVSLPRHGNLQGCPRRLYSIHPKQRLAASSLCYPISWSLSTNARSSTLHQPRSLQLSCPLHPNLSLPRLNLQKLPPPLTWNGMRTRTRP